MKNLTVVAQKCFSKGQGILYESRRAYNVLADELKEKLRVYAQIDTIKHEALREEKIIISDAEKALESAKQRLDCLCIQIDREREEARTVCIDADHYLKLVPRKGSTSQVVQVVSQVI